MGFRLATACRGRRRLSKIRVLAGEGRVSRRFVLWPAKIHVFAQSASVVLHGTILCQRDVTWANQRPSPLR